MHLNVMLMLAVGEIGVPWDMGHNAPGRLSTYK